MVSYAPWVKETEDLFSESHSLFNHRLAGCILWHVLGLSAEMGTVKAAMLSSNSQNKSYEESGA